MCLTVAARTPYISMCQSVHSGSTSALHSMGEQQLWSEWETQGGGMMHEWSTLMRGPKPSGGGGRDSVMYVQSIYYIMWI